MFLPRLGGWLLGPRLVYRVRGVMECGGEGGVEASGQAGAFATETLGIGLSQLDKHTYTSFLSPYTATTYYENQTHSNHR